MTAALAAGMCGACREQDCECCDLLVWGGTCDCGCPLPDPVVRMPLQPPALLIIMNHVPPALRPSDLPRVRRTHCNRGHALKGSNVYRHREAGQIKTRCLKCRRRSWRTYRNRRKETP